MTPRGLFDEPPPRAAGFAAVAIDRAIDQYPEGLTYLIPEVMGDLTVGDLEPECRLVEIDRTRLVEHPDHRMNKFCH